MNVKLPAVILKGLIPVGNRVAVAQMDAPRQSSGGIHLPDSASEAVVSGRIIAVGDGMETPPYLAAGDVILFNMYDTVPVQMADGSVLLIVKQENVIAKAQIKEAEPKSI